MNKTKKISFNNSIFKSAIKGSMLAVSISLILILLFALLIKFTNMPDKAIMPINQIIKILSIFLGCYFALKSNKEKGLVKGCLIGVIYTILAFLTFSILGKSFNLNLSLLNDLVFASLIGGLCGIFLVNKKIRNN